MRVEVVMSGTGNYFTFQTPIATLSKQCGTAFYEALLYRQYYADQVEGLSFSISAEGKKDVVLATYHWMLDSISPVDFKKVFMNFVTNTFDLIEEINHMSKKEKASKSIHKGRLD